MPIHHDTGMHRRNMEVLTAQHERNIAVLRASHQRNMAALLHHPLHPPEHLIHPHSIVPLPPSASADKGANTLVAGRALTSSSSSGWSRTGLTFFKEGDGVNFIGGDFDSTGVLGSSCDGEGESESEGEVEGYCNDRGAEQQGLESETATQAHFNLGMAIGVEDVSLQLTLEEGGHTLPIGEEAIPSAIGTAHDSVLIMGDIKLGSHSASDSTTADRMIMSTEGGFENEGSDVSGRFEAAAEQALVVGAKCIAQVGQLGDLRSAALNPSSCLFEFTLNTCSGEVSCSLSPQLLYREFLPVDNI